MNLDEAVRSVKLVQPRPGSFLLLQVWGPADHAEDAAGEIRDVTGIPVVVVSADADLDLVDPVRLSILLDELLEQGAVSADEARELGAAIHAATRIAG